MKVFTLFLSAAPLAFSTSAWANTNTSSEGQDAASSSDGMTATAEAPKKKGPAFTTGVAKGRDLLNTAISASAISDEQVQTFGARSLAEIYRNIPGIRAEAVSGEGSASYSIRGLPLAANGSKYVQFQEDGLPVLEFGDLVQSVTDQFMRADLTLSQVQAIRGGSASTFASNSPGGVINLLSKTGTEEGGMVQATVGIDYEEYRTDFNYGAKLSDSWRFNIGGFYREGEGPRRTGTNAYRGGQVKFNVTKTFSADEYIRFYFKLLDDRVPNYMQAPVRVTGSNDNPTYESLPGFDIGKDSLLSKYIPTQVTLDGSNNVTSFDVNDGIHSVVKSFGFEAQVDVAGWTVTERFRFSDIGGALTQNFPLAVGPAALLSQSFGGPGARLGYATGPLAGQAIANPSTLNGNGLMAASLLVTYKQNSLDNMTNDLRASRVWDIGSGKLTTTAGFYKSSQTVDTEFLATTILQDVRGDGESALLSLTDALGRPQTQGGVYAFTIFPSGAFRRLYDVNYSVNAPYGSVNYAIGRLAIGGSLRYDFGRARGSVVGTELTGSARFLPVDINRDGAISQPETRVGVLPLDRPSPVNYDYNYLSYSTGVNFRVAEPFAVFARYSKGGRASADRLPFTPSVNSVTGNVADDADKFDPVTQVEVGAKFRSGDLNLFATGFWAKTTERNQQVNTAPDGSVRVERIIRDYEAKGVELEGSYAWGPFSIAAGATYTKAEITGDPTNPGFVGNKPRHSADLIYSVTPKFENDLFTVGANVVGTTESFAQDSNLLVLPAFTTVNAFAQFRPVRNVQISVNANNLFDVLGFAEVTQPAIPAGGVVTARSINGRTISTSLRFSF